MCGIAGILSEAEIGTRYRQVHAMTRSLVHRGPNDGRIYVDYHVALGFRRLAIIDLESGAQPLSNEDGTVWQVFNGEIYNFLELRRRLLAKGHIFRTRSDSEVIVHAYEEWGDDFVHELKGMFALALWDSRRRRLVLAVDRFGIKPLYYAEGDEGFVFASEAKALFASGIVPCEADYSTLPFHMAFLTAPFPRTMFKGVWKLAPGHMLVVEDGRLTDRAYWNGTFRETPERWRGEPFEDIAKAIDDAVMAQSLSDVPLGAFLSGGIDSSAVCEALVRGTGKPIETYFISFAQEDIERDILMDEQRYARMMAERLRTMHHEITATSDGLERLLPRLAWHLDEPIGDPAAITTYLVSKAARETLTVLMSGVGGDEIFGGYPRYLAMMLLARYRKLPAPLRHLLHMIGRMLPGGRNALFRNARKFLRAAENDPFSAYMRMLSYFSPEEQRTLFTADFVSSFCGEDLYAGHRRLYEDVEDQPVLNRLQAIDLRTFLPCLNLTYTDRMSMAASIEVRVPLLYDDLVFAMTTLPVELKIRGRIRKYAFKKSMVGRLPEDVILRRKAGFGAPIQSWLAGPMREMKNELLGDEHLRRQGIFSPQAVRALLEAEERQEDYYANHIWQLLAFQLWHRVFIDDPADLSPASPPPLPPAVSRAEGGNAAGSFHYMRI